MPRKTHRNPVEVLMLDAETISIRRIQDYRGCQGCEHADPIWLGLGPCCTFYSSDGDPNVQINPNGSCASRVEGPFNHKLKYERRRTLKSLATTKMLKELHQQMQDPSSLTTEEPEKKKEH